MTAVDYETRRLAAEAADAIRKADLPKLRALLVEVEARAAIDAMSRAAMTPWPPTPTSRKRPSASDHRKERPHG